MQVAGLALLLLSIFLANAPAESAFVLKAIAWARYLLVKQSMCEGAAPLNSGSSHVDVLAPY